MQGLNPQQSQILYKNLSIVSYEAKNEAQLSSLIPIKGLTKLDTSQYTFDNQISSLKQAYRTSHSDIKHIIAVASGKGGVGKSTTTVNLARTLASLGAKVGILDADIYGPSIPLMLGLKDQKPDSDDGKIMKAVKGADGIVSNSIGYLIEDADAAIWRGPMASKALTQLFEETAWGKLDYLLIDLPPGTGDIQLTLAQKIPMSGAVIVSTPQDLALADARKAHAMFNKVDVDIIGLVENMSVHRCSNCGHESHLFGDGGARNYAIEHDLFFLGEAPLTKALREYMDAPKGQNIGDFDFSDHYLKVAVNMAMEVAVLANKRNAMTIPITITQV